MFNWADLIAPASTLFVAAVIGIFSAFFKWLERRFKNLEDLYRKVEVNTQDQLDKHEIMDQKRHEENLSRFEKISISLARMGARNTETTN